MPLNSKKCLTTLIIVSLLNTAIFAYPMSGYIGWGLASFNLKSEKHEPLKESTLLENDHCGIYRFLRFSNVFFVQEEDFSKRYGDIDKDITLMYNSQTGEKRKFPQGMWVIWYFQDKNWIVCSSPSGNIDPMGTFAKKDKASSQTPSVWIIELNTNKVREIARTIEDSGIKKFNNIWGSYSYSGAFMYFVDQAGKLIEHSVEPIETSQVIFDLADFLRSHASAKYFELSPPSPNRKYMAIQAESELYLINLEAKTIQHIAGKTLGFFGGGVEGPLYWDKDSKYLLFGANFDWVPWVYDHDVYYYDVEQKSIHQIKTGHRLNGNFWYSWE
ncbi:MAG: hypothetical protein AB7F28_02720 [Candidatus Margulisiibacteriota bacterium]